MVGLAFEEEDWWSLQDSMGRQLGALLSPQGEL